MIISKSKKWIIEILRAENMDVPKDLTGYHIDSIPGNQYLALTKPAPEGEPAHYHKATNTGGRRIVAWVE